MDCLSFVSDWVEILYKIVVYYAPDWGYRRYDRYQYTNKYTTNNSTKSWINIISIPKKQLKHPRNHLQHKIRKRKRNNIRYNNMPSRRKYQISHNKFLISTHSFQQRKIKTFPLCTH